MTHGTSATTEQTFFLISAYKKALEIAMTEAPESRVKYSLTTTIERSGSHDTEVSLTNAQREYITDTLAPLTATDDFRQKGAQEDMTAQIIEAMVVRFSSAESDEPKT